MSISPQYTFDKEGNPVGVFLSIEDWNQVVDNLSLEIPDWQKKIIDERLNDVDSERIEFGAFLQSLTTKKNDNL